MRTTRKRQTHGGQLRNWSAGKGEVHNARAAPPLACKDQRHNKPRDHHFTTTWNLTNAWQSELVSRHHTSIELTTCHLELNGFITLINVEGIYKMSFQAEESHFLYLRVTWSERRREHVSCKNQPQGHQVKFHPNIFLERRYVGWHKTIYPWSSLIWQTKSSSTCNATQVYSCKHPTTKELQGSGDSKHVQNKSWQS